jgi:putative PIN family toxin of toxin-antitoxin system
MRIVIDTNVLISAILRDRKPEAVILFVVSNPDIEWIVTPDISDEYKNVLRRPKFRLPSNILNHWTKLIDSATTVITEKSPAIIFPRDQKDAIFLECALIGDADFLITGDGDFKDAKKLNNTKILSVSLFYQLMIV